VGKPGTLAARWYRLAPADGPAKLNVSHRMPLVKSKVAVRRGISADKVY